MKMIIDGQKVDSSNNKVIEVRNMSSMELIDTVPAAAFDDVQRALEAAQLGAVKWSATPIHQRVKVLKDFVHVLRMKRDELAELLCAETGKILSQAKGELDAAAGIFEGFAEEAKRLFGETIPLESQPGLEGDLMITIREPLGVCVGIIPFNVPTELYAHKVGPALAAGNSIIVKPSNEDPLTLIKITELLHESGVPGDVLQIVTGPGKEIGDYLTKSPLVNFIGFTGSTEVGISIARNGAENLTHYALELGGNDPIIVWDDADVDMAVQQTIDSRLLMNGQICCATKRILLHESIHDVFRDKLVQGLKQKRMGDHTKPDTDVGPLINEKAASQVEEQIVQTIRQGAKLILGGKRVNRTFIEPTVLEGVTGNMDVARDLEIFGPVFPLIKFKTYEEAIEIANNSIYGLNAAIYTKDIYRAIDAGNKIKAGMVSVNGSNCYRPFCSAFGGYKKSGIGREGTAYTLKEYTQIKNIALRGVMRHERS